MAKATTTADLKNLAPDEFLAMFELHAQEKDDDMMHAMLYHFHHLFSEHAQAVQLLEDITAEIEAIIEAQPAKK